MPNLSPQSFARGTMRSLRRLNAESESSYQALQKFRALSPLPKNAQEMIDNAIVRVGRHRLTIVSDLIDAGLTFPLTNWLGVPILTSHRAGEAGHAQVTMVPKARGERQITDLAPFSVPIPCTWDDFSLDIRTSAVADRSGYPIDTDQVEQATRNVNEAVEDAAINGGPQVDNTQAVGLLATTNTQAYVDNQAWTHADHSGEDILQDIQNMVSVAQDDKFYGPYNLYVPGNYWLKLGNDFKSNSDKSVLTRLRELEYGGRPINIRPADKLPANRTLLIQMTSDVVDVVVGQTPATINWEDGPGFEEYFIVLACIVTRVKSNSEGNYGIVAGNTT